MPDSRFQLSHFTLHAPSEGLSYWFVAHDFAGTLGLDYSRDAAKELKKLFGGLGVAVDYEADDVTVRIRRSADVVPALRAIYGRAGWDAAELEQIEQAVRTFKRPRAKKIAAGDTFLIPLGGDAVGLGQVLEVRRKVPTVVVFPCVGQARDVEQTDPASLKPLAVFHLGLGCSLFTGGWPVVASHPVSHSPSAGFGGDRDAIGGISFGGDGYVVELLRAHAGLDTWEQKFVDPDYLRRFLLE